MTAKEKKLMPKEIILNEIALQLSQALTSLKDRLGEKKFDKRIRKAAKLLGEGIKSTTPVTGTTIKPASKRLKEADAKITTPAKKAAPKKTQSK